MIRKYWEKIRPTSTEYDPETSTAENEIERLQCLNRRLKYKIKAKINQLKTKLKNIEVEKNEIGSRNRKLKFAAPILIAIIIWQGIIIRGYGNEFQEKVKGAEKLHKKLEEQKNTFIKRELLVAGFNKDFLRSLNIYYCHFWLH